MEHKLYYPVVGGAGECENCGKQNPDHDENCKMSDKILYEWEAKGVKNRIADSSDGPVMQWQPGAGEWLTVLSGTFVKAFAHLAGRVEELEAVVAAVVNEIPRQQLEPSVRLLAALKNAGRLDD